MKQLELPIIDSLGDSDIEPEIRYEITSYGADFTSDGIVKRLKEGDIYVPPFQRGFVWTYKQASRFIESLLLGLPVPGIFLSKDIETQKMIIIDGQQRLKSLKYFYKGVIEETGKAFRLTGVSKQFEGLSYDILSDEDRRRLDNSILHATIVQQDKPAGENTSVFYLFERLNTSGTPLQPQEVRSSIYSGKFNDLLKDLNKNQSWRLIMGPENKRLKDRELILRFFALFYNRDKYSKPMREFLNQYMGKNRFLKLQSAEKLSGLFENTIDTISKNIGPEAFKPARAINAAVYDSVMIGVAKRLQKKGKIADKKSFLEKYSLLLKSSQYIKLVSSGTADEPSVKDRIELAIEAFANIP